MGKKWRFAKVSELFFSDNYKNGKVLLSAAILMISAIHFYIHYDHKPFPKDRIEHIVDEIGEYETCFYYVKLFQRGEKHYFRKQKTDFEIMNMPNDIEDLNLRYAIRGMIKSGNVFELHVIRQLTPRYLKIIYSICTVLIIIPLFFLYFHLSHEGFKPRTGN